MKSFKKFAALFFCIALILTALPLSSLTAFAATSGITGDCTWVLEDGVLTISGNGRMGDYSLDADNTSPWYNDIKRGYY